MDLQNARFHNHDGVVVNTDRVEEVHGVRDDRLMLLALRNLLVQRLAQLGSYMGIVNWLRLRLGSAAPHHGLTRRGRHSKVHVRAITGRSDSRGYS
eukprot:6204578-Pleurochrysis_carterae.AAC.1